MNRFIGPALVGVLSMGLAFQRTIPARASQSSSIQVSTLTTFPAGASTAAAGASNTGDVVALEGSNVLRIGPKGQQKTIASLPPGGTFGIPIGIAVTDSHRIFVADPRTTGSTPQGIVWEIDPNGTVTAVPGSQGMLSPDGFGFDSDGNLYVTDIFAGSIWKIPPGGAAQLWASGLATPDGVKVYDGKVYTSLEGGQIETIDINPDGSPGARSIWASDTLPGPVFFDDMVLDDRTGDVYVANLAQNEILQITPQGSESPVASCANGGLEGAANMGLIHNGNDADIYLANGGSPIFGPSCPTNSGPDIVQITIPDK